MQVTLYRTHICCLLEGHSSNPMLHALPEPEQKHRMSFSLEYSYFVHYTCTSSSISLHWLPVKYRIMFKVICTVFKCLNGLAPEYLTDLICEYEPVRTLRSSGTMLVEKPKSNTKTWGDRSFRVAGPHLWNSLPMELRTLTDIKVFKGKLKTHLFTMAFEGYL